MMHDFHIRYMSIWLLSCDFCDHDTAFMLKDPIFVLFTNQYNLLPWKPKTANKLMVHFQDCEFINDGKREDKEENKKQVKRRRGEAKRELLSTKWGHICAEQKASIGFSWAHTHVHVHTHTLLPQRFNAGADSSQWSIRLTLSCQHSRVERDRERKRWMGNTLERGFG